MAKVTYASLKLKTNTNVNTINFNGNQIEVLQYLPIEEKYSLVNITLAQAKDEDIFNPIKKDMYLLFASEYNLSIQVILGEKYIER